MLVVRGDSPSGETSITEVPCYSRCGTRKIPPCSKAIIAEQCNIFERDVLLVLSFSSHSRIFHSFGDVTITGEGLQILIYARHSWPLSSESSLTCNTYCDTGQPLIMVISEDPWHSHQLTNVWQWNCHYLFKRLRSIPLGDRTPISSMRGKLSLLCHHGGSSGTSYNKYIVHVQPTNQIFRVSEHLFDFFQWYDQIKSKP